MNNSECFKDVFPQGSIKYEDSETEQVSTPVKGSELSHYFTSQSHEETMQFYSTKTARCVSVVTLYQ